MDAKHWNGDDDREFGPDPGDDDCPVCHAGPNEDCREGCECAYCLTRPRTLENLLASLTTPPEAA